MRVTDEMRQRARQAHDAAMEGGTLYDCIDAALEAALACEPEPTYPGRTRAEEAELRRHPEYEPGAPTYVEWLRGELEAAEAKLATLEQLAEKWDALAADAERFVESNPTMGISEAKLIAGSVLTIGDALAHCARELRERAKGEP